MTGVHSIPLLLKCYEQDQARADWLNLQGAGGRCIPFHCFSVPPPTLYLWNPDQFLNNRNSSLWRTHRGMQPHQLEVTLGCIVFPLGGCGQAEGKSFQLAVMWAVNLTVPLYLKRFSSTLIPEQCLLDGLAHPELRKGGNWKISLTGSLEWWINVDITVKIGTKCKDVCILFKFPKGLSVTKNQTDKNCLWFFY